MRSASLNVPQSRLTSNGAPATLSPLVGICDWLSAANAEAMPTAPAKAIVVTNSFSFDSIWIPPCFRHLPFSCRVLIISWRQDLFTAKPVYDILDHFNAEAGSGWRIDPAIHMLEWPGHQIVLHRIADRLELEQLAGR